MNVFLYKVFITMWPPNSCSPGLRYVLFVLVSDCRFSYFHLVFGVGVEAQFLYHCFLPFYNGDSNGYAKFYK